MHCRYIASFTPSDSRLPANHFRRHRIHVAELARSRERLAGRGGRRDSTQQAHVFYWLNRKRYVCAGDSFPGCSKGNASPMPMRRSLPLLLITPPLIGASRRDFATARPSGSLEFRSWHCPSPCADGMAVYARRQRRARISLLGSCLLLGWVDRSGALAPIASSSTR